MKENRLEKNERNRLKEIFLKIDRKKKARRKPNKTDCKKVKETGRKNRLEEN